MIAARSTRELASLNPRGKAEVLGPGVERHHDLLERRVPGSLADPVDRAFPLSRARAHARERVGYREAEIVVTVRRQHDIPCAGNMVADAGDHRPILVRHRVADGVGNVERRRAGLDGCREYLV